MDAEDRAKLMAQADLAGERPCRLAADAKTTCGGPAWGSRHEGCRHPTDAPFASLHRVVNDRRTSTSRSTEERVLALEEEVAYLREQARRTRAGLAGHISVHPK